MSPTSPPMTFAVATTVEDPLTAETLVDALLEKEIDAFSRARGSAGNDALGAATTGFGYWEILVPTTSLEVAGQTIEEALKLIEDDAGVNAQAAEDEAMSGENPVPEEPKR